MGVMMIGAILYGIGLSVSGMAILLIALVAIYASAIWGLCVTWHRSRTRGLRRSNGPCNRVWHSKVA